MKKLETQIRSDIRKVRAMGMSLGYTIPKEILFSIDPEGEYTLEFDELEHKVPVIFFGREYSDFDSIGKLFMIAHEVYHIIDPERKRFSLKQEQFLKNPTKKGVREQQRLSFRAEFLADAFAQKILFHLGHSLSRLPQDGTEESHKYKYGEKKLKSGYGKSNISRAKGKSERKEPIKGKWSIEDSIKYYVRTHPSNEQRNRVMRNRTIQDRIRAY